MYHLVHPKCAIQCLFELVFIPWASFVAQLVKHLPAVWKTWVWSLVWRPGFDSWAGNIPCRRERLPTPVFWPREFPGQSMGLQRVGHDWATFTFTHSHLSFSIFSYATITIVNYRIFSSLPKETLYPLAISP